jgi:hypothetical protein
MNSPGAFQIFLRHAHQTKEANIKNIAGARLLGAAPLEDWSDFLLFGVRTKLVFVADKAAHSRAKHLTRNQMFC